MTAEEDSGEAGTAVSERKGRFRLFPLLRNLGGPVVLETVLIVASILLAFAIDAAWDDFEERERERDLLVSLQADFQHNSELLDEARALHQHYLEAAQGFLEYSAPGSAAPDVAIPDDVLIGMVSWNTYDPALGSLNSAIASGQISLIRDDSLRVALASWMDSVEDLNELEIVDRGHAQRFAEVAFEFVPFRSISQRLGAPGFERLSTAEPDYQGLANSLVAENIAANRVAEIGFMLGDLSRVETELDAILERLEVVTGMTRPPSVGGSSSQTDQ